VLRIISSFPELEKNDRNPRVNGYAFSSRERAKRLLCFGFWLYVAKDMKMGNTKSSFKNSQNTSRNKGLTWTEKMRINEIIVLRLSRLVELCTACCIGFLQLNFSSIMKGEGELKKP